MADTCTWTLDVWDESSMHETSCGQAFHVEDCGQLSEHGFKFCVYCGKPIHEERIDKFADEDESNG
jgi:RNA polymerase-binding transcription factor DksA